MADASLRPGLPAEPISVDQVELVTGQGEGLLVLVTGRWRGRPPADPLQMHLAVPHGGGVLRFPVQAPPLRRDASRLIADPEALNATFSLPEALLPALAGSLSLQLEDGKAVALPPLAQAPRETEEKPTGQVVDRAVLAERRARRAELGEQASARRAAAAEQASADLQSALDDLQRRLTRLDTDREEAEARVQDRDRSLRAAVQRLHSEQRRREEAADEATRRVEVAEAEVQSARRRVAQAERETGQLRSEVEELHRRAAEAENALGAAVHARSRAEAQAAEATEALAAETAAAGAARSGGGRTLDDAEHVLSQARGTIAQARERLDELELAHSRESGRADAEQAARRALEEELEQARAAAAAAERAVGDLRAQLGQRAEVEGRARALMAELHDQVRALHDQTDDRTGIDDTSRELLAGWLAGARQALEDAEARIAEALSAATQAEEELARERAELERERQLRAGVERALEQEVARRWAAERRAPVQAPSPSDPEERLRERLAEASTAAEALQRRLDELGGRLEDERIQALERLVEEREAAAAAEASRATLQAELERRAAAQARAEWRGDELGAQLAALRAQLAGAPAAGPERSGSEDPWLARGLRIMAREDPADATPLLLQLLRGHEPSVDGPLEYDLELASGGLHAVSVGKQGVEVRPLAQPRSAAEVGFRLALDAPALVELLLQGGSPRLRRAMGIRVLGTRRPRRALRALRPVEMDPAALAARGVWLDPRLCFQALVLLMDPSWTRGHRFVVAQEVEEERAGSWYVRIDDGLPPRVTGVVPPDGPAATVRLSRAGFQRLLGGDSVVGEKAALRGDVRAVGLLARWVARVHGVGSPASG